MSAINIALEMEKRGRSIYSRALGIVSDPSLLKLLGRLESEEQNHYDYFQNIVQKENNASPNAPESEWIATLAPSLAAEALYPGGLMQAAYSGALESPEKLISTAIESERASIKFYEELIKQMPESEKPSIKNIILQEQSHLAELLSWQQSGK